MWLAGCVKFWRKHLAVNARAWRWSILCCAGGRAVLGSLLSFSGFAAEVPAVTFHKHIAPILLEYCAPCHRPGESGPFPLLTYEDARKRAGQIAAVTRRRYMPPWLPEAGTEKFAGERRLTELQIELIGKWAVGRRSRR